MNADGVVYDMQRGIHVRAGFDDGRERNIYLAPSGAGDNRDRLTKLAMDALRDDPRELLFVEFNSVLVWTAPPPVCPYCGKPMPDPAANRKYCSPVCERTANQLRYRRRQKAARDAAKDLTR